jgi:hypothetical protein
MKLVVLLCVAVGYLIVTFGADDATRLCVSMSPLCTAAVDGIDPPHAVDVSGKVIPPSSVEQPQKPIILAKDSQDSGYGEFKTDAAFDHLKHSTDVNYSVTGKSAPSCAECHHTDQASAPKGQEYLGRFDRKESLTAKLLETSKQPVRSCRECHFQEASESTNEFPPEIPKNAKNAGKAVKGKITNDVAYHTNCIGCHRTAQKRNSKSAAPTGCGDCHTQKS